jgi:hypothetical protein
MFAPGDGFRDANAAHRQRREYTPIPDKAISQTQTRIEPCGAK